MTRKRGEPIRLLHTADWHLGRTFHGVNLLEDQEHALEQVLKIIEERKPDAVLIAGDVYDRSVPAADTVGLLNRTLTRIVHGLKTPVILIAGNHDSSERLHFASELLGSQGLHMRGNYSTDAIPIVLRDEHGPVHFCALPFATPLTIREAIRKAGDSLDDESDANSEDDGEGANGGDADVIATHESSMEASLGFVRQSLPAGERCVLVAHAFVSGSVQSPDSETQLSVGGSGAVSPGLFAGFNYVALGHLHSPQQQAGPGGAPLRYAGSLLKYSFSEVSHKKGITLLEMDARGACTVENIPIRPRHDLRELKGDLRELIQTPQEPCDDYLRVVLTDTGALVDPVGQLRRVYPNVLEVTQGGAAAPGTTSDRRAAAPAESPLDLFVRFFEYVTSEAPTDDEKTVFADCVENVTHAARKE